MLVARYYKRVLLVRARVSEQARRTSGGRETSAEQKVDYDGRQDTRGHR